MGRKGKRKRLVKSSSLLNLAPDNETNKSELESAINQFGLKCENIKNDTLRTIKRDYLKALLE